LDQISGPGTRASSDQRAFPPTYQGTSNCSCRAPNQRSLSPAVMRAVVASPTSTNTQASKSSENKEHAKKRHYDAFTSNNHQFHYLQNEKQYSVADFQNSLLK